MYNNSHPSLRERKTPSQKAADKMTATMGSWTFIVIFMSFLIIWIAINSSYFLIRYYAEKSWDPYPFILLNLILSCLAAIQAPVILMSQNRESQKDRLRAEYDYAVNRKAEREIEIVKKQLDRIEKKLSSRR